MHHRAARYAAVLAALTSVPVSAMASAPTRAIAPPADTHRTAHVSIVETGAGSPVILIPGLASPRAVWDGIVPELARSHRVILVQLNGFGGDDSGANAADGVLDGVVADLSAYIAAGKLEKPAIIGHSMGGLLGLMMAKAHPDQVGRIMIVDALPYIGTLFVPNATVEAVRPMADAMRRSIAAARGPGRPAAASGTGDPGGNMSITPEGRRRVADWGLKADPGAVGQAMYEVMTTDLRGDLSGIATPATMLYPSSPAVPPATAKALYEAAYAAMPHVRLVEVPGSYHFIQLDQPARFAAEVKAFLAE